MRIESLALIIEVVKTGSISAAARKTHVQQTTLSAVIKSVENELNITIFERQYKGVLLTHEGEELAKIAESMLSLYRNMMEISQRVDQKLVICVNRLIYSYFCYDVLPKLHMSFPNLTITLSTAADDSTIDKHFTQPQIRVGCCRPEQLNERKRQADSLDLMLIELLTSEFMIYVNRNNPLSRLNQISGLELMRGQRVILDSYCADMFHMSEMDKIVRNYSLINQFDPMHLINSVLHGNIIAYAVDKRIIPVQFHTSMADIVPVNIEEPEGKHLRHVSHYIVCQKERQLNSNEKAVVEIISEMLHS